MHARNGERLDEIRVDDRRVDCIELTTMSVLAAILRRFLMQFRPYFWSNVFIPLLALVVFMLLLTGVAYIKCWYYGSVTLFRGGTTMTCSP